MICKNNENMICKQKFLIFQPCDTLHENKDPKLLNKKKNKYFPKYFLPTLVDKLKAGLMNKKMEKKRKSMIKEGIVNHTK